MAVKFQHTTHGAKIIIIIEFLLVTYLLYTLTASVYKSYQIDQHIKAFEAENERIEDENLIKSEEYEYYSSEVYVEKIAKQNLGLVNHGEEVLIIPSNALENTDVYENSAEYIEGGNNGSKLSNPEKWWNFFFDTER